MPGSEHAVRLKKKSVSMKEASPTHTMTELTRGPIRIKKKMLGTHTIVYVMSMHGQSGPTKH